MFCDARKDLPFETQVGRVGGDDILFLVALTLALVRVE